MNDNIQIRAMAFLSAFPAKQFQLPMSEQPWPHRSDLAHALEHIEDLCKALHEATALPSAPIAETLTHARELLGLSLAEAAKMAGISKSHLWEIEAGRHVNPSLETMRGLSRALGLKPSAWFTQPLIAEAMKP